MDNKESSLIKFIKSCGFIFPDENAILGSTKLFKSLWLKCFEMDKVALALIVKRGKSLPKFAVLEAIEDPYGFKIRYYLVFKIKYIIYLYIFVFLILGLYHFIMISVP